MTSSGMTNRSIEKALLELLGKPFEKANLVFIPTAAYAEKIEQAWLKNDIDNFRKLGFYKLDVVDISETPKDIWLPLIKEADVMVFGGGNAYFLMEWLSKSGLKDIVRDLLRTRVYVGISAGSMVATSNFISTSKIDVELYDEKVISDEVIGKGLGLVSFQIVPHLNSAKFPKVRIDNIENYARQINGPIYAIDDDTAIKLVDNKTIVISEGKWQKFN